MNSFRTPGGAHDIIVLVAELECGDTVACFAHHIAVFAHTHLLAGHVVIIDDGDL